jgi:hypothetical protein
MALVSCGVANKTAHRRRDHLRQFRRIAAEAFGEGGPVMHLIASIRLPSIDFTIDLGLALIVFVVEAAIFGGVGFYYWLRDMRRDKRKWGVGL